MLNPQDNIRPNPNSRNPYNKPEMTYLIRCGKFVKIGKTHDIRRRLETLQIGNPHKLEVLGLIPGGHDMEWEMQGRFCNLHHRGEWYKLTPELQHFIDNELATHTAAAEEMERAHRRDAADRAGARRLLASLPTPSPVE